MRLTTTFATLITVTVGLAAAQTAPATTSSSSSSSCQAQNILDACLTSTKPQLKDCEPTDWKCLCEQSNNVLTCYNNCPNDSNRFGVQQTKESYCNAAKAYDTTTTSSGGSSTRITAASFSSLSSASKTIQGNAASTATSTDSSAQSSSTSSSQQGAAADGLVMQAGTLFAAFAVGLGVAL